MEYKKHYIAEFLGTFLLLFFASGAVIYSQECGGVLSNFQLGLVSGITVWLLIQFFGRVSDCHINPAVTLCFFVSESIPWQRAVGYISLQLLGALVASLTLYLIFPSNDDLGNTLPSGSWQESFVYEFVLSFVLILVILFSTSLERLKPLAPFLIGLVVFIEAWLTGPICGASMNPARSFGPALVSGNTSLLWLYFVAPICGMLSGLLLFRFLRK